MSGDAGAGVWQADPVSSDEGVPDGDPGWTWDPSLYRGSAEYYAIGRAAYPGEIAEVLRAELDLDGSGRLLDVGCGPGSLTLLLAPLFAEAIGVDPDADMLAVAGRLAAERQVPNVGWRRLRGEELPADLPRIRVATFAQSFHWMDRPRVARAVRGMLDDGGALVHVSATTHRGVDTDLELPHPQPPYPEIATLVQRYLGTRPRAGQGVRTSGPTGGEDAIYRAAGFTGGRQVEVPGRLVDRTTDQIAASTYSLSSSAPHLFGDRLDAFDADLRRLLAAASPSGRYSEQLDSIRLHLWR